MCEADLVDERVVEQLFDACQILEGAVSAHGWRTLFRVHGLDGLLRINRRSDWFEETEAAEALRRQAMTAGYDPRTDSVGMYDERTGEVMSPPIDLAP